MQAGAPETKSVVRDYEIYLGDNPQEWGSPAAKGRFRRNAEEETIRLSQPVKARYLKFVALSEQSGSGRYGQYDKAKK